MFVSVLERQRASWKTDVLTRLSGKGTAEGTDFSGLQAPPENVCNQAPSRGNGRVNLTPWPGAFPLLYAGTMSDSANLMSS